MKMKIHTDFSHRSTSLALTPLHPILLIRTRIDSDQDEETCTSNELPPRILERDNVGSRSLRDSDEFRSRSTATQPLLPMVGPGKSLTSCVSAKRSKWADRGRSRAASTGCVQMAVANSKGSSGQTLYYYGGQAITSASSTRGNWTNALVSIDLSTGEPPLHSTMNSLRSAALPRGGAKTKTRLSRLSPRQIGRLALLR